MEIEKVISALNSPTRRKILRILTDRRPKTLKEIIKELQDKYSLYFRRRESVFKALKKLEDAGLIKKLKIKEKGVCYSIIKNKLIIDLTNERIEG